VVTDARQKPFAAESMAQLECPCIAHAGGDSEGQQYRFCHDGIVTVRSVAMSVRGHAQLTTLPRACAVQAATALRSYLVAAGQTSNEIQAASKLRCAHGEEPPPPAAARREYRLRRHHPPCAAEGSHQPEGNDRRTRVRCRSGYILGRHAASLSRASAQRVRGQPHQHGGACTGQSAQDEGRVHADKCRK